MGIRFSEEQYKDFLERRKTSKKASPLHREKETDIQNQIRDYLRMKGWLSALKDGITIYIEVKTSKGYQSDYQKQFQQDIESHGGVYILARSIEDVQDIEKYLGKQKAL